MFEQYSPKEVVMSCYGFDITGFSEDAMIDIEWENEKLNKSFGCSGETFVSRSGSMAGTVTVHMLANSPTNGVLEGVYLANEIVYNIVPQEADTLRSLLSSGISIHNHNNGNIILAPQAILSKLPSLNYSKTSQVRSWEFYCPKLVLVPSSGIGKALGILSTISGAM